MIQSLSPYIALTRLNKPIGIWLFLCPTLWALWLAAGGLPPLRILLIFIFGAVVMRSVGCVINDICDQKFDGKVERTKQRPLVTGQATRKQAFGLFTLLSMIAIYLAWQLNALTLAIATAVFLLAIVYPLTKRFSDMPQFFLGATVAGAIPMAFASVQGSVPPKALWIYAVALLWPLMYDTLYAMADRQDDKKIGIKSTALGLGDWDRVFIGTLQVVIVILLMVVGSVFSLNMPYYLALACVAVLFFKQQQLITKRDPVACFQAFLANQWVGIVVFLGIILGEKYGH